MTTNSNSALCAAVNDKIRILVVGGDHPNTLASVRALGVEGIPFDLIIHGTHIGRKAMVASSKYAPEPMFIGESYAEILQAIDSWMERKDPSHCILLPSSDLATLVVDERFRPRGVHACGFTGGKRQTSELMDKDEQARWAAGHGIPVPKGGEISPMDPNEACPIEYPVIIKPAVSAEGQKSDITICRNARDYRSAIEMYRKTGYKRALVQELIDYEYELTCIGVVLADGTYAWRAYAKDAVHPVGCGSTALAHLENDPNVLRVVESVMRLMSDEGYRGPCDIELFRTSNRVLLNEVNFRQSGIAAFTFYEGLFMPALWVRSLLGDGIMPLPSTVDTCCARGYAAMSEDLYLYYTKESGEGILAWIRGLREPGGRTLRFPSDNKPFWVFLKSVTSNQLKKFCSKFWRKEGE